MTNLTASIIFSSDWVWITWSTQNKDEYEIRGEITDLTVGWISTFFVTEDPKLPILKWSLDDTRVFKHNTASWRSRWLRSWTAENPGSSCRKNPDSRKSSNEWWWKQRIGPESITEMRPFWINDIISEFPILTPESITSTLSLNGCLAKIMAPTTETISWTSHFKICPNDVLITVVYKENKLSIPSISSPSSLDLRIWNHTLGSSSRKLVTIVAQIKIPVVQGTR